MATIISFVSQKGGVGKTTSAINLATAFAFGGYSVLMVDLDPQSSIRFSMGVQNNVSRGTQELFLDPEMPMSDLIQETGQENMEFIFSNVETLENERAVLEIGANATHLLERINEVSDQYDFIVIDAPSSTNNMAINAIYASDLIILPLQCENLAIKSLKRFLRSFNELKSIFPNKDLRLAGILLTMFDRKLEIHRRIGQQIYKALSDSVFETIIPRNEAIVESSALGKSVITYNLSTIGATAYIRLMNELVDKFDLR
ncbi:MAG: ParA family protein [Deltaproteobacteria bacterium]|jgi:chromosome partitioning protein|nr:ParA family protein [Deltaproteobacteria bacterium]MBT4090575.1 ParA family protein [Deltaproteobacteria bacterium]MBT4263200.1 ParA family protein [Deltaproteobacteria bacterium]MBT4640948.1 ParA family protein [Deltaproteobacteria bacterium]MBT6501833.1 ParA family protein [Deltaproteobacteria bacterium]